jgi:serine/threonine protein kinase
MRGNDAMFANSARTLQQLKDYVHATFQIDAVRVVRPVGLDGLAYTLYDLDGAKQVIQHRTDSTNSSTSGGWVCCCRDEAKLFAVLFESLRIDTLRHVRGFFWSGQIWRLFVCWSAPLANSSFHGVLEELAHLHANGYAHLDLRPENVLLELADV